MKKKNVVLIIQDHQLFYNHKQVKRPNYEEFCRQGLRFDNAVSVTPLCSPARRSILNGLYPHNHGQINNAIKAEFKEQTYYDVLRRHGYQNYYFGKWHAGDENAAYFGCDGFSPSGYSSPYKYKIYDDYLKRYHLPDDPKARITESFTESDVAHINKEISLKSIENLFNLNFGELLAPKEAHECFFLANLAIEQLERIAGCSHQPFTLRVDFWGPHQPYYPTREFLDMYDEDEIELYPSLFDDLKDKPEIYLSEQGYGLNKNKEIILPTPLSSDRWKRLLKYAYAHNTMVDYAAGAIVNKIKELGLLEDTLIIWSADHGDALCSHGGHIDKDCYLTEEVLKIPLAIMGAGKSGGDDRPASNLDIPLTILDYCGLEFDGKRDGVSLLKEKCRDYFVSTIHGHFKTHHALAIRKGDYKYVENLGQKGELYNLKQDPYEMRNLIDEANYKEVLSHLNSLLEIWKKEYRYKI